MKVHLELHEMYLEWMLKHVNGKSFDFSGMELFEGEGKQDNMSFSGIAQIFFFYRR